MRSGTKGPSGNKVYILLLAPRPAGKARATSIPAAVCKERATQPAGLRAAARRGAAAGGHLRRCRSWTVTTSPASRRLASARPALAPKCTPYFLTGPKPELSAKTRRCEQRKGRRRSGGEGIGMWL